MRFPLTNHLDELQFELSGSLGTNVSGVTLSTGARERLLGTDASTKRIEQETQSSKSEPVGRSAGETWPVAWAKRLDARKARSTPRCPRVRLAMSDIGLKCGPAERARR